MVGADGAGERKGGLGMRCHPTCGSAAVQTLNSLQYSLSKLQLDRLPALPQG